MVRVDEKNRIVAGPAEEIPGPQRATHLEGWMSPCRRRLAQLRIAEVLPIVEPMTKGETPTHARLGIGVENAASSTGSPITDGPKVGQVNNGSGVANAG